MDLERLRPGLPERASIAETNHKHALKKLHQDLDLAGSALTP